MNWRLAENEVGILESGPAQQKVVQAQRRGHCLVSKVVTRVLDQFAEKTVQVNIRMLAFDAGSQQV